MSRVLKKGILYITIIFFSILIVGCGGNKIEVSNYTKKLNKRVDIPEVCKIEYKSSMPRVAVVDFTNNSTFGKANVEQTSKNGFAAIGLGFTGGGFMAGGVSKSNKNNAKREVDSKLSQSIVPIVETMVLNTGGATLISRNDMDKIDEELKLQDSGLLNPDTVVQMGEMTGVQFLVTGSINNVEQELRSNQDSADAISSITKHSDNEGLQILGNILQLGAALTDAMKIKTVYTIKIIDVESGKIVFSEDLEGTTDIGKISNPTFDQIVGAIKKNISDTLPQLKEQFSKYFAVKGYISQLRSDGDDIIAQVSIGSKHKVKENQIFKVYTLEENTNPFSGKVTCDRLESSVKLKATNQIMGDKTWTTVEDGDASELKLYQLIQK